MGLGGMKLDEYQLIQTYSSLLDSVSPLENGFPMSKPN